MCTFVNVLNCPGIFFQRDTDINSYLIFTKLLRDLHKGKMIFNCYQIGKPVKINYKNVLNFFNRFRYFLNKSIFSNLPIPLKSSSHDLTRFCRNFLIFFKKREAQNVINFSKTQNCHSGPDTFIQRISYNGKLHLHICGHLQISVYLYYTYTPKEKESEREMEKLRKVISCAANIRVLKDCILIAYHRNPVSVIDVKSIHAVYIVGGIKTTFVHCSSHIV